MISKHKRIIFISTSTVILIAILIWYFLWVIAGKWFIYKNAELLPQLNVRPSKIEDLPLSPPDEWENISIDTLSLSLPMKRFNKIRVVGSTIGFISDQGSVVLPSLVPTVELLETFKENNIKYPLMSYEDLLAEFNAVPDDISFLKTRNKNKATFINLTLKLMAIPSYGINDILAVDSSNVKAICIINKKGKNGFGANIILYNQAGNMTFDMTLVGYKTSAMLHSDILNILGSIKIPSQPLNAEKVKTDIENISRNYNLDE